MPTFGPASSQKATSSRLVKSWWFSMTSVTPCAARLRRVARRAWRGRSSTSSCHFSPQAVRSPQSTGVSAKRMIVAPSAFAERRQLSIVAHLQAGADDRRHAEAVEPVAKSRRARRRSSPRATARRSPASCAPSSVGDLDEAFEAAAVRIGARRAAGPAGRDVGQAVGIESDVEHSRFRSAEPASARGRHRR